jgi:diguanylate cyclase (GGDEF)-like protein
MPPRRKSSESLPRLTAPGAAAPTVLVADDDRAVRTQIRAGLDLQGYRFVEAGDGAEVLTALRVERPDLLVMDVEMPGLGGVEVCRIVKANQGHGFGFLPVILMTALRTGSKVEGLELGADDYLIKPFDMLELSARVKSMLRLKALQDALLEKNRQLDRANQELEKRRQELLELSRTDALTGLANRRLFDERLEAEFQRSSRYRSPLSCLMMDLDHFKRLNDQWGHAFGDEVLRQVAAAARRALRDVDLLARYGGEELVALLPETGLAEAVLVAERVRAGVEGLRLAARVEGRTGAVRCTASLGVATFPGPGVDSGPTLVAAADACLYAAKAAGRNRVADRQQVAP